MFIFKTSDTLDRVFYASLIIKAIDAILEIIGGFLLLLLSPVSINKLASLITQYEISRNPHDFLARHIIDASNTFVNSGKLFAAFYLLSHGLVKIILVIALFKQYMWAYPGMIFVLGCFVLYQVYRLSYRFSFGLLLLTVFDVFVIWLTYLEYRRHLRHFAHPS